MMSGPSALAQNDEFFDNLMENPQEGSYSTESTEYKDNYVIKKEIKLTIEQLTCNEESWELVNCSDCVSGLQICKVQKKAVSLCEDETAKPSGVQSCTEQPVEQVAIEEETVIPPTDEPILIEENPEGEVLGITTEEEAQDEEVIVAPVEEPVPEEVASGQDICAAPRTIAAPFIDTTDHWAHGFIETMRELGIVHGRKLEHYIPDADLTRAELTKIILNTFCISVVGYGTPPPFPDVPSEEWHAPFVDKAKLMQIVQGYEDSMFHPNQSVTRAEAIKMLMSIKPLVNETIDGRSFADIHPDAWYNRVIASATSLKIVQGYDDNTFRPNAPITRGEMAKIVVKTLESIVNEQSL